MRDPISSDRSELNLFWRRNRKRPARPATGGTTARDSVHRFIQLISPFPALFVSILSPALCGDAVAQDLAGTPSEALGCLLELVRLQGTEWDHLSPCSLLRSETEAGGGRYLLVAGILVGGLAAWWIHAKQLRKQIRLTKKALATESRHLAFLAHEVRNSIQAFELALTVPVKSTPDLDLAHRLQLNWLNRTCQNTIQTLNDLLDRHLLSEGRLRIKRKAHNVIDLVEQVVRESELAARVKGLALVFESGLGRDIWFEVDAFRLKQILLNITGNAIKFNAKGKITLKLDLQASSQGVDWRDFCIAIQDEGAGLQPPLIQAIASPTAPTSCCAEGTGIGLELCRDLLQVMGGKLIAQNLSDGGCRFDVVLPLKIAPSSSRVV